MELGLIEFGPIELVLGLFVVIVALAYLARRVGVAYPILLVLGGLVLGYAPGLPTIELEPDVVFLLLLPPILFGAAYSTPIRDFKANARPIALLAVGLVLFTTVVVGSVVYLLVPSMGLAPAFALGAIVAPPDAVAATSIFRRIGAPPRIVTILEGESLVNDASALIAYRFAVTAAVTGIFVLANAGIAFVYVGLGGILVGLLVGFLVTEAWKRTGDPTLEIMVSLLAPVRGLPAGRGARRQRGPGRRRGGPHRRAPSRPGPVAECAADGAVGVEHRHLHDQRHRVHADRAPAAEHPGGADRMELAGAPRHGPGDQPDRDRGADRVGLPGDVRPAHAQRQAPGARSVRRRHRPSSSSRGRGCAARSRWPPPWPCR